MNRPPSPFTMLLSRHTRRREFITLLGGAAAAWPLAARAQQAERMRRIGVLMNFAADDPESQARIAAFLQGLQQLGWTDGRNVRIDFRWAAGRGRSISAIRRRSFSRSRPDVILGHTAAPSVQRHCSGRPAPCRSCSRTSPTRSAPGLVAQPGAAGWQRHRLHAVRVTALAANGWSCSRSRAARDASAPSFGDPQVDTGTTQFAAHPGCGAVAQRSS